ncbi:hypothetical protein LSCM1_00467 [Leishmania martiniquensis]|uniref:Uncharacterized protein n=1 Tax=Leishmania martiniquensis TaxID=1580590 RepID=A0A836K8S6_9TRYP|nr:hypothetical protein LSCM1_00467 [Leishmania martiniquensis]
MSADEEGVLQVQRFDLGCFRVAQPHNGGASSCTPRTVRQRRTRQFPEHEHLHPFSNSLHDVRASVSALQLSPCSFVPTISDAPVVRRVRSLSCLSGDRSVAPARYSVGHGAGVGVPGQSSDRHTASLSGAASAVAAARPTVLFRSSLPSAAFSTADQHGEAVQGGHEAAGDLSATRGSSIFVSHTYAAYAQALSSSVPRLTRLSLSSNGCSPAVQTNWSIGRPTTLRCLDTDSDVNDDQVASQGEEDEDREPWCGGSTQVWCGSEVGAPLPCFHGAEEQSAETLAEAPTSHTAGHLPNHRDLLASSPPIAWQPPPLPMPFPASQLDFSSCFQGRAVLSSGAPETNTEEETNDNGGKVTRSSTLPAIGNVAFIELSGSLADLEAAPRKSYIRSDCETPPRSDLGRTRKTTGLKTLGGAASGAPAGTEHTSSATAAESITHHIGTPLCADVRSGCSPCFGPTLEWRSRMCSATPQERGVRAEAPSQLRGSEYPVSVATAEAVAAQLARISIRTSPTPKRLAFEEEELAERGSGGCPPTLISEACTSVDGTAVRCSLWNASGAQRCDRFPAVKMPNRGVGSLSSNGRRRASLLGQSGDGEPLSNSCPTGLQLLRSRKRCLADMQAAGMEERNANALAAQDAGSAHYADYPAPDGVAGVSLAATCEKGGEGGIGAGGAEEALKRQRREEQRRKRLQHVLPGAPSRMDNLTPDPVPARCAEEALSSSAPPLHVLRVLPTGQLAWGIQPQQSLADCGDRASRGQMSSIDFATPAPLDTSTDHGGIPGSFSQGCHGRGVLWSVGCDSQILAPLPTNVPPPPSRKP